MVRNVKHSDQNPYFWPGPLSWLGGSLNFIQRTVCPEKNLLNLVNFDFLIELSLIKQTDFIFEK